MFPPSRIIITFPLTKSIFFHALSPSSIYTIKSLENSCKFKLSRVNKKKKGPLISKFRVSIYQYDLYIDVIKVQKVTKIDLSRLSPEMLRIA